MKKIKKTSIKRKTIVRNKMIIITNKPKKITTQAKIDSNRNNKKMRLMTKNAITTMTIKGKPMNLVRSLTRKWEKNKTDMKRKVMTEKRRWKITMVLL